MIKHVNILGTKYDIYFLPEKELSVNDVSGYCERWSKEIFINEDVFDEHQPDAVKNMELARNKTVRHELLHAILHEAGFDTYSEDEVLVDALAVLAPKIHKIFTEMEANE